MNVEVYQLMNLPIDVSESHGLIDYTGHVSASAVYSGGQWHGAACTF